MVADVELVELWVCWAHLNRLAPCPVVKVLPSGVGGVSVLLCLFNRAYSWPGEVFVGLLPLLKRCHGAWQLLLEIFGVVECVVTMPSRPREAFLTHVCCHLLEQIAT